MACLDNARLFTAYFDGELDAARSVEFEEHLGSCPECAADLRAHQALRQSLRAPVLYERAPDRLRNRIGAAPRRPAEAPPSRIPRGVAPAWLAVAAGIVVVLLGATLAILNSHQQRNQLAQEIVASHIRSLQAGHLFDVESTDQHTVKPWFDGRLDFSPPVRDLAAQGFPLVGGRLDYVDQRNVAALVFGRRKHIINVFVWPADSSSGKLPGSRTIQGYNLMSWSADGMTFCAISDVNLADLREFVGLLTR